MSSSTLPTTTPAAAAPTELSAGSVATVGVTKRGADGATDLASQNQPSSEPSDDKALRPRGTAALALVSQAVSSGTNFLRLVFITNACSAAQLSDYTLGMTLVLWIMAIHERLVATPYSVFAHRYQAEDRGRLLGSTVLASLGSTVPPAMLLCLAGLFGWWTGGLQGMGPTFFIVGLAGPIMILRELARTAAFANFRMYAALGIDVSTFVVQAVAIGLLWTTDTLSVGAIYASVALSAAVAVGGWLIAWRGRWSVDFAELRHDWSELWTYSRWLLVGRVMGALSRLLVPWIVVPMVGKIPAGRLAACATLVGFSWLFIRGVSNYFVPVVIKSYQEGGAAAVRRSVGAMSLVFAALLVPLCIMTFFAGEWLLTTVSRENLAGLGMVAFLLSLNALVTAWAIAAANGLLAIDQPQDNVWIEAVTLIGTLVAAVPLISAWGISGAAGAMLVGNVAGAALAMGLFLSRLASEGNALPATGGSHV